MEFYRQLMAAQVDQVEHQPLAVQVELQPHPVKETQVHHRVLLLDHQAAAAEQARQVYR
jgi:hypothetical protein